MADEQSDADKGAEEGVAFRATRGIRLLSA
jgi:hypothetical protein